MSRYGFAGWLVCNGYDDGHDAPSVIRKCRGCGAKLWVTKTMLILVDRGELRTRCWTCHVYSGTTLMIHDREIQALDALGRLDDGQRIVDEMNKACQEERDGNVPW